MRTKPVVRRNHLGSKLVGALLVTTLGISSPLIAGANAKVSSETPLRIAVLVATSGANAHSGTQIVHGVKVAVAVLNAKGGVDGHKVVVTYQNTKSSAGMAVKELRSVAKSGIDFVIGATNDASCTAMLPVAEQLKVTMVSPTCEADSLTGSHPAPNYFEVAPNGTDLAVATDILIFRADATIKTFVISFPDSSAGKSMEQRVEQTLHYTDTAAITATLYIPPTARSVTSYVSQIESKAGSTVGLISFTSGATLINMLKAEEARGVLSHYAEDWASVAATTVLNAMGSSVPNMWLSYTYYYAGFRNAANTTFVSKFKALEAGDPTPVNEMGYVAVQAIAAGVAESRSVDAPAVAAAMKGVSFESPEGTVTVNPTTHLVGQSMLAIHVKRTSTGTHVVQTITIPFTTFNYSG